MSGLYTPSKITSSALILYNPYFFTQMKLNFIFMSINGINSTFAYLLKLGRCLKTF